MFAIVFATALANGKQPVRYVLEQGAMRTHLMHCLQEQTISMFPIKKTRRTALKVKSTTTLHAHCKCRMPGSTMIECSNRPFPQKIPLGISVAMATTFLVLHALQAWMAPFTFEVNWMFNGVDMTSQTYTHFIWAHMGDLVWRRLQCKSLIWAYIKGV